MKNINPTTILFLLLCLLIVAGCKEENEPVVPEEPIVPVEPPIASGTTGELTWTLSEDGTLTISGKGEMPDYGNNVLGVINVPWGMYRNEITDVIIGNGVSKVSSFAFVNLTNLTSVTIGKSVTSIGYNAFGGGSLTFIDVDNDNTAYSSENGVLFNKTKTMLVQYPTAKTGAYTIPNSVTSIENLAFFGCRNLASVTIPNSVTSIGNYAFRSCIKLTSISIPNLVTSIGDGAFYDCGGLTSVTIPNSVTFIGIEAFGNCTNLTSINVDSSNTTYSSEDGVLFNKTKTKLIIYPTAKTGAYTILSSVKSIEDYAFAECIGLTLVTIPNLVIDIGKGAFWGCSSLTSVTIGNSVTTIGDNAFHSCHNLMSVTIGNSVASIGNFAFWGCSGLTSITIPDSVITIGIQAFSACSGLTEVINKSATPQDVSANVFYGSNISACTLRVPEASLGAYRATGVWKDFGNIVAI